MPQLQTTNRMISFLIQLKKTLRKPTEINLVGTLRDNNFPHDYSSHMMKKGVLIKVFGGKRGPSRYVWNTKFKITTDGVNAIIQAYNDQRRMEKKRSVTDKDTVKKRLIRIESMLLDIKGALGLKR